jgi:putative N6-adenine-specific DNA methylase
LEASWLALQIPPAIKRENFTFMQWLDFQPAVWEEVLTAAKKQILPDLKYPIIGSDYDRSVLKEANHNAKLAGVEHHVEFIQQDFADIEPPSDQGLLICNPPYGARLGDLQELKEFYQLMGDVFKQRFKGWTAYVLTGNRQLMKSVGLRTARRIHVNNGSIECTLMKYELY